MMPQVKYSFPHQYHLALDLHHAVTDGICTMKIIEIIIPILDSVLDGAHVDSKQIGEFRDRSEATSVEVRIRESLEKDPHMLNTLLEERHKIKTSVPLITEIFGKPDEPSPETYAVTPQVIDDKLLQVFNAKCKRHKVTFNSAFVGVINVALMELAHEAGVARDSYIITHRHPVDTRRYMSNVTSMVWGYHVVPMTHTTTMPCNARSTFWENVINFDTNFRDRINTMGPLQERILDTILQETKPDLKNMTINNLMFTNMYSPRVKPFGDGKHVQLTKTFGYLSMSMTHHQYCITGILTRFREQVQFQVGYYSGFITKENAARISDKVVSIFNDIAKEVDEKQ
uniref:Condensation domain-containing protein n=1 Tax=Scylla olivacea TaxID=85551 RepID=A0A0P4VXX9_SCYOL